MVERVFLHIGLPKTGTTYLQRILWKNREALVHEGVHLPGFGHREHLWAALDVQDRPHLARRDPRAPGAYERLCAELDAIAGGVGLISHEFFSGATSVQARRAIDRLAPAEVHLIVTARDVAGLLAAGWQEMVKNGGRLDLRAAAASDRHGEFSWDVWDLHGVLTRWDHLVPPESFHIVPIPGPGTPYERHWVNFAKVLGLDSEFQMPDPAMNVSLGAVQVELLRTVNAYLEGVESPFDRGQWIRGYLAESHLVRQAGERFTLDADLLEDCRERSRRAVEMISARGFAVTGDVRSLLVPDEFPDRRDLASVTAEEMVDSAAQLIASLLSDVRRLSSEATSFSKSRRWRPHGVKRVLRRIVRSQRRPLT